MRLFHAGGNGRYLVGQWAGTARGLRDLTGNIGKDAGVSTLGLAGELASRIATVVGGASGGVKAGGGGGTPPEVYNALIKTATASPRLTADVITEGAGNAQPRNTLLPGEKYRLRVSPQDAGTIYILSLGVNGKPSSPYAQNEPLDGSPGRAVTLPPNSPFIAPKSGATEWVILLRRKDADKASVAVPGVTLLSMRGVALLPGALEPDTPQYGVPDLPPYGVPDTISAGAPVAVIGGAVGVAPVAVAPTKGKLDEETERILGMMKRDAPGTWVALSLKLPVVPADGKTGSAAPAEKSRGSKTVQTPLGTIKTAP